MLKTLVFFPNVDRETMPAESRNAGERLKPEEPLGATRPRQRKCQDQKDVGGAHLPTELMISRNQRNSLAPGRFH